MSLTPSQFARKVPRAFRRKIRERAARVRDRVAGTHISSYKTGQIRRILPDLSRGVPPSQRPALAGMTDNYLAGRFDVLGSGWLSWHYGEAPPGREGHRYDPGPDVNADPDGGWIEGRVTPKNLPSARKLWQLVQGPYQPIAWQLDVRSGASWSAAVHALDTPIGVRKGADIKAPWELAKLQHLPRLALAYGLAHRGEPAFRIGSDYVRGFRNQVCDFLALNPPRYGANWATAMLAGIRIANILVAYDLFRAAGIEFDEAFEGVVLQTALEHARHILDHLDWWDLDRRNNHYLANIAGLAFVGAYLPDGSMATALQAFCRREIDSELKHQFSDDGSHFEGSTAYHAFSLEMAAWTVGVLSAVDAPGTAQEIGIIPREARRRAFGGAGGRSLAAMRGALSPGLAFLNDVTRPDGLLLQVGDNDSSRFLTLDTLARDTQLSAIRRRFLNLRELPDHDGVYWEDAPLDYAPVVDTIRAVCGSRDGSSLSAQAARALCGAAQPAGAVVRENLDCIGSVLVSHRRLSESAGVSGCRQRFEAGAGKALGEALRIRHYPDAGISVFSSDRLWLSVRCAGAVRADGGHAHDDAMSFELHIDGVPCRVDPGAYVYTSLPWRRRQFRSQAAHGVPRLRGQGAFDDQDVFAPVKEGSELIAMDENGLVGARQTTQGTVYRVIRILDDAVEVADFSRDGQPIHIEPLPWWSPGYGRLTAFEASGAVDPDLRRTAPDRAADADTRAGRRGRSPGNRTTA